MLRLILLRVLETFFRSRWSYILTVLLPMVAGVVFFVLVPASYNVRGTIYVQSESLLATLASDREVRQFTAPSQATLSEISSLLNTESFAISVLQNTNLRDGLSQGPREKDELLAEYRSAMSISAEGNNIVVIASQDPDPVVAQQLASETMNAYVRWRIEFERADSEAAQTFFADLITRYDEELADAEQELRDYLVMYPDPVRGSRSSEETFEIDRLQRAVDEASTRIEDARQKEEDARLSLAKVNSNALQEYLVIDAPSVPSTPPSMIRRAILILGIFTVLGLALAAARLTLAMIMDRSLYFPLDVLLSLKQTTLALLPLQGAKRRGKVGSRQETAADDQGAQAATGKVSPAKG